MDPGYIRGYVPGVRENGGQYTHGAIWAAMAYAALGDSERAWELTNMINPVNHARTAAGAAVYKVEPYVVAADVYGVPPHVGRGGWTWYTGSASWLYRAAVETLLGLTVRGQSLTFDPRIPEGWHDFEVEYRQASSVYRCRVENPNGVEQGVQEVWLDGQRVESNVITLADDGRTREVRVVMG
jgi:cellobiose phosphorylase